MRTFRGKAFDDICLGFGYIAKIILKKI